MTRAKLLMLALGLALIAVFAAPAAAQDGPTLTVDPTNVDAAGEHEFMITGAGWTAAPPIFVLPCAGATTPEEFAEMGVDACDISNLTPVVPADGAFEATVTYDVPEAGMCIVAGDQAQTESALQCITVGAADGGEEAAAEETTEEATEELADTGVESGLLAIIGLAVVAAGAMTVGYTRRFA